MISIQGKRTKIRGQLGIEGVKTTGKHKELCQKNRYRVNNQSGNRHQHICEFYTFLSFPEQKSLFKRRKDCSSYNWNDLISKVPQIQSYKLTWSSTDILTLNGSSSTFIIPCSFAVASLSNRDKSCWRSFSEKER